MRDKLDKEDEKLMRECCLAVDTNAYEFIKVLDDNSQTSLRGLYPLAAILNHECSPNTSHVYDRDGIMQVTAAKHIKAGDEITTCYTSLIWSTSIRRLNLLRSKQFACRCARCADPTVRLCGTFCLLLITLFNDNNNLSLVPIPNET